MNEIEKLNERIAQLTELVKSGEETISATKEMLKLAEQERDRLADQRRESEPKFERVDKYKEYFSLTFDGGAMICEERDCGGNCYDDTNNFECYNYFHTDKRAQEVADKINLLLRLERLHDTFCPDYVPDWNDSHEHKHTVYYTSKNKQYNVNSFSSIQYISSIYFPSAEIAQKVCDILNAEERNKDV